MSYVCLAFSSLDFEFHSGSRSGFRVDFSATHSSEVDGAFIFRFFGVYCIHSLDFYGEDSYDAAEDGMDQESPRSHGHEYEGELEGGERNPRDQG